MKNLGQMFKQAQEMQAKLAEAQDELEKIDIEGSAGGGLVKVIFSGKGTVRGVHISPSLVTDGDVGVIEDLIVAAANDARKKVDARNAEEMNKLTDGLNLPAGLKLPF